MKKKAENRAQNRALNFEKHTKWKKIFLNIFLLGFWPKTFLTSMKLNILFLKLVSVKILLKINAHQKARQKTSLDVHNKNSITIIDRE